MRIVRRCVLGRWHRSTGVPPCVRAGSKDLQILVERIAARVGHLEQRGLVERDSENGESNAAAGGFDDLKAMPETSADRCRPPGVRLCSDIRTVLRIHLIGVRRL